MIYFYGQMLSAVFDLYIW